MKKTPYDVAMARIQPVTFMFVVEFDPRDTAAPSGSIQQNQALSFFGAV